MGFYEQQLRRADKEFYRIKKLLPNKGDARKVLVKWKGYHDKFNRWLSKKGAGVEKGYVRV